MPVTIDQCARAHGKSVRECVCLLPNKAGWAECPTETKGIIPPYKATRPTFSHVTGDVCPDCDSFNVVRRGTCPTCQDCGCAVGGCS